MNLHYLTNASGAKAARWLLLLCKKAASKSANYRKPKPVGLVTPFVVGLCGIALISSVHAASAQSNPNSSVQWLASYTGESATNISGGMERGSAYAGQLFIGADINLQPALDWDNTVVHVAFTNRHGKSLAQTHIGNSTSVQEIYGGQNSRLTRFSIETTLLDGQLELEAGRTVANISFLGSQLCQYFQTNAACGNPTFVFRTSNFSWWPVSSWGGRAKYWLSSKVYLHAGVYEENSAFQDAGDHGFNWSTKDSTGVVAPVTLGYQTSWETDRYPKKYEVGGWYDSTDYDDPLIDDEDQPAVISGKAYAPQNGRSGIFTRFEQVVSRPDSQTRRSLTVFGNALTGLSGESTEDYYLNAGLVKRGTFAGRDDDTIGFVITYQHYSDEALENQRLARAANGGVGTPASSQTMMELSYGVQVHDHIRIQPNVHYIINPDQFSEPGRTQDLADAWVVGMRFDVDLAGLLLQ